MKVAIIGRGNIGKELERIINNMDWEISVIIDIDGVYKEKKIDEPENYEKYLDVDVVFLSIPTVDDGTTAYNYMSKTLKRGIPVVTCEKGSLANYFAELKPHLGSIGYSATVGGGTRMLRYMKEMLTPSMREIHAIVNGTLNFIFYQVTIGQAFDEAVTEAKNKKYTEPGADTPIEIINKEANGDIPMKATILFNLSGLSKRILKADDIKVIPLIEEDLKKLVSEAKNRRFIVSISKQPDNDVIGGFSIQIDDWYLCAGFKTISSNELYTQLSPKKVDNGLLLKDGEDGEFGIYKIFGPGAGPGPTAASMIKDAMMLVQK